MRIKKLPTSSFHEIEERKRLKLTSIKSLNTTKNSTREFSYIDYRMADTNGN